MYTEKDVTYSMTYNENTGTVTATVSGSTHTFTPYSMKVYKQFGFTQTLVNTQTSSTPITTFAYTIPSNETADHTVVLEGTGITTIGTKYIQRGTLESTTQGISVILIVVAVGVILALTFVNPMFGVIGGVGIIIVFAYMKMLMVSVIGISGLVVACAFLMWRYLK
jgi:hypothetical protein